MRDIFNTGIDTVATSSVLLSQTDISDLKAPIVALLSSIIVQSVLRLVKYAQKKLNKKNPVDTPEAEND